MKQIMITGCEGRIGKFLSEQLQDEYDVIGIDVANSSELAKYHKVDISKLEELQEIFKRYPNCKTLLHFAGARLYTGTWYEYLHINLIGTKNLYECARESNYDLVILASSSNITGCYEGKLGEQTLHLQDNPKKITVNDPLRPNGDYASTKAYKEALARQYYELYGIRSICLRIGTFKDDDNPVEPTGRLRKTWLSHRDCLQLIKKCLESKVKFGIYYAISNNKGAFLDISNTKEELGFDPQDDGSIQ